MENSINSSKLFAEIIENAGTGLVLTDKESVILFVNNYFAKLCGYTVGELTGNSLNKIFSIPETNGNTAIQKKNGDLLQTSLNSYKNSNGNTLFVVDRKNADDTTSDFKDGFFKQMFDIIPVITSYSIHYTKLYDNTLRPDFPQYPRRRSRRCRRRLGFPAKP